MAQGGGSRAGVAGQGQQSCEVSPLALASRRLHTQPIRSSAARCRCFLTGSCCARTLCPGVSPEVVEELAVLVGRCCQLRQAAMSAEGAKALALFDGRRKWAAALGADANAARWAEVLQVRPPRE